jgi:hypothetical protein
MVADEAGYEDRDDGEQGHENEQGGEARGGQADPVHHLLRHHPALQHGRLGPDLDA